MLHVYEENQMTFHMMAQGAMVTPGFKRLNHRVTMMPDRFEIRPVIDGLPRSGKFGLEFILILQNNEALQNALWASS
jgi:hypothetical protein